MMKYVYGSMATIGILAGIAMSLTRGLGTDALLAMIFGAVCIVAAEVSELSEKFKTTKHVDID